MIGRSLSTIDSISVSGSIMGTGTTIGGLVGSNRSGGSISRSSVSARVISTDSDTGGLVGENDGTISASSSSGDVVGTGNVGGLVGQNGGAIVGGYSSSSVTGTTNSIGGLVGANASGTISAGYSSGDVTGNVIPDGNFNSVGGLVGMNTGFVTASYSSGSVTATPRAIDVGGLMGGSSLGYTATSYWIDEGTIGGVPARVFGNGEDDCDRIDSDNSDGDGDDTTGVCDDPEDSDNIVQSGETNNLVALGQSVAEMRASSGTYPNFSAVALVIDPFSPATPIVDITGDFSDAWDYTAGCYPRLKRWMAAGSDTVVGTADDTFHATDLLPGQGTLADMTGACAP